jgi:hypothetical protein
MVTSEEHAGVGVLRVHTNEVADVVIVLETFGRAGLRTKGGRLNSANFPVFKILLAWLLILSRDFVNSARIKRPFLD